MVYFRRSPTTNNRKITKVKMGDIIRCWRSTDLTTFSSPGRRHDYHKTQYLEDKQQRGYRRNVYACKLIVTAVYDYYIYVQDKQDGWIDTLTLGDLVMLGYEPEYLGSCLEEHRIKTNAPVYLRS